MSRDLRIVTAYDPEHAARFRRWRRARWSEDVAGFTGTSAQLGIGTTWLFGVRATSSRRRWALTLERGRRRYAAIVVAPRITCAEEVAAEALAAIAADGGPEFVRLLDAGRLERATFERWWDRVAARRQRREGAVAGAGSPVGSVVAVPAAAVEATATAPVDANHAADDEDDDDDLSAPILQPSLRAVPEPTRPATAVLLCTGTGFFESIGLGVDLHMQRADGVDVLWQEIEEADTRPLGHLPSAGDLAMGGQRLLAAALRAGCLLHIAPDTLIGSLVATNDAVCLWQHERARRDRWAATAEKHADYPILVAARELGLEPTPSRTGPYSWYARCPGTNHSLMVQAKNGEFGCGWCRRRGGVGELREFVGAREKRHALSGRSWQRCRTQRIAWGGPWRGGAEVAILRLASIGTWRGMRRLCCASRASARAPLWQRSPTG